MNEPKKRPGPLWMFFYGRQRRGVPWLLLAVLVVILVLAGSFAIPGASETMTQLAPAFIAGLLVVAVAIAIVAAVRPRRRP